jgi:retinol dehydrogenase-12
MRVPHMYPTESDRSSTVLNVFFARELAARVASSRAIVNCVNPGLCHSSLARSVWKDLGLVASLRRAAWCHLHARTTEAGARELVWAAVGAGHREWQLHGRYISDMQVVEESDFSLSMEGCAAQEKLWVSLAVRCWRGSDVHVCYTRPRRSRS